MFAVTQQKQMGWTDFQISAEHSQVEVDVQLRAVGSVKGRVLGLLPSKDDRPPAWVLIDGREGEYPIKNDGIFHIPALYEGEYLLQARSIVPRRRASDWVRVSIEEHGQTVEVELVLPPLPKLHGVVRCRGGGPTAPGIKIEVSGDRSSVASADHRGSWSIEDLPAGAYTVTVRDHCGNTHSSDPVVFIDSDLEVDTFCYCSTLYGMVVNDRGDPVDDADVKVAGRSAEVHSKRDGSFELSDMPPVLIDLVAKKDRRSSPRVTVDMCGPGEDAVLVLLGDVLRLSVRNPDGRPAHRLLVKPVFQDRALSSILAHCSTEGICSIELEPETYSLLLESWEGAAAIEVKLPNKVVPVQLHEPGELEIRLAPSIPFTDTWIRVRTDTGITVAPAWFAPTDVQVLALPAGTYQVDLWLAEQDGIVSSATATVVANGTTSVELQID
jgi:hypothetical protein